MGNDVFISVHKNYFRKNDVVIQTEVAKVGKNAKEVESVAEFAKHLMCYLEENYEFNIPLESTPDRCCGRCKNFKVYPTHGSLDLGYCTLKSNNEKIVNEDGLCEQFEKEEEKICLNCENYQPKTLNHGHCGFDVIKAIRFITDICNKNI